MPVRIHRRTTWQTVKFLQNTLIKQGIIDNIIAFKLAPWRINLDGCFVPVDNKTIVSHLESILETWFLDEAEESKIDVLDYFHSIGFSIIRALKDDSIYYQVCNIFCASSREIFAYGMNESVNMKLGNFKIHKVEGTNLVLGTGGPRCMTRPIYS